MLKFCEEFAKKSFSGKTTKDAYLKAIKWVAKNIISQDAFKDVIIQYEKDLKNENTMIVRFYTSLKEKDVKAEHCQCCKEMHKSFFINENFNCNRCAVKGYEERLNRIIKIKTAFYRERIKAQALEEGE